MTSYKKREINIDELSVLVYESNFTSRIEENQSEVPHRNIHPFSCLIDIDPIGTTSVEIHINY
jgi:hypothetical protein